jgi:uncharacterized membrane protein
MTTQRRSFRWGLLLSAVLLWLAALTYGQAQPKGITSRRGASPAMSLMSGTAAAAIPTQGPMFYHGGLLLPDSTNYAFWWGNPADFPADAKTGLEQFLAGLNGSSYLSIADQYMLGAKTTTRFGGNFYDSSAPPSIAGSGTKGKAIGDFQLELAIHLYHFLTASGVTPDPTGVYFIFTSNYAPNPFFCGFHDALFSGTTRLLQFAYIPNLASAYSCMVEGDVQLADPYLAPNNYSAGTHAMVSLTAHEFMETITDPDLVGGWYDVIVASAFVGNEIADPCAYVFQNWVQLANSSNWKTQEIWSNQAGGCVQGDGRPVQLLGAASTSKAVTTFNIPGATYGIFGTGINDGGTIAGTYYDANFYLPSAVFVLDPLGNITTFNVPGATAGTTTRGINSNGTIVGTYTDAAGEHGYLRDPLGNFTTFNAGTSSLSNNTHGLAINAAGAITGTYEEASLGKHGFVRDTLGNITTFDAPGMPYQTEPVSINDNDKVAGFYANLNQPPHGFVRDVQGDITTFDVPGGVNGTEAFSINLEGAIAGTYTDANFVKHGFVRSPTGVFTTFDAPGAVYGTVAHSINKYGAVAGFYSDAEGVSHGFVRDPYGNFTILSDIPWSMNDNGMTTGYATVPIK